MRRSFARRSLLMSLCTTAGAGALVPATAASSPEEEWLRADWPDLARYREQNLPLKASRARIDAVFIGDFITAGWLHKARHFSFPAGSVAASADRPRRRRCCASSRM